MANQRPSITLTRKEIQDLYEFAMLGGDDDETADYEYTVELMAEGDVRGDQNEPLPAGWYVCEAEYPEEGWTQIG